MLTRGAHHDPRRLVQREAAYPGAEGDHRQRPRAEFLGLLECRARRSLDDLGVGAEVHLHRRRVDDPVRRHIAAACLNRLAQTDRRLRVRLVLDRRPAGAPDRSRHTTAEEKPRAGSAHDRADVEPRHGALEDFQLGPALSLAHMTGAMTPAGEGSDNRSVLVSLFRGQADWCRRLGSVIYGSMLERTADDMEARGPVWRAV